MAGTSFRDMTASSAPGAATTVWTIGHSTRTGAELVEVLRAHGIELVADVRRFPGSRRLPQFQQGALEASLAGAGIDYQWMPELGGRRRASSAPDVPDAGIAAATRGSAWRVDGWRHAAFRAYAAHVATPEFRDGLAALLDAAFGLRTAVMCAEVLWWRCHRRLIADVLVATGYAVVHIRDARVAEPHRLTTPARLIHGRLSYAADDRQAVASRTNRTRSR